MRAAAAIHAIDSRAMHHAVRSRIGDLSHHIRLSQPVGEVPIHRKASCPCGGGCPTCQAKSADLKVSQPHDAAEIEADTIADKVMQEKVGGVSADPLAHIRSKGNGDSDGMPAGGDIGSCMNSSKSGGSPLDQGTRTFFEPRFGADLGAVNIHTANEAVQMNRQLNARAFTIGNDIYFNQSQYRPDSAEGKHLLAHELTHTIQQRGMTGLSLQRKKYDGKDDAGFYEIDDDACTFNYRQDWYFDFGSAIALADQPAFMQSGKNQVESGWSNKYKLVSGNKTCACGENGFTVNVELNTHNKKREGKHGYTIDVEKDRDRSVTNPLTGTIKMESDADVPENMGHTVPMDIMSHEFGHTLGLQDEYNWWAALFGVPGSGDKSSLMHRGNDVKPWHYQHFADMLNLEMARCTFYPEGGAKRSSLAEPVSQLGFTTGALFNEASLNPSKAEFVIGLNIDARVSSDAVLGLFYPTLGFDAYLNVKNGKMAMGPTAGLRLNRLAHPLYLDISTGVLFAPGDDQQDVKLNVPLSTTLGIRGRGFNVGVNYTPMFDLLNGGKYSHIVGLNLQFDVK
ncbi:MAG: DUF4157 domain-containing protein [Nitrospira sp. BO4]|jgi:hypothetical protein|nr:DUF4157 domain-containing protein [Nitrospira sp. BO4]